ncbi:MAG: hypothetical protein SBU_000090 [Candidatus Syntrophoarchaeum butanivorans]|uniref:Uncharacterized protein n=1 Tax=Candidatus Syntropharchaeum butanivorans TaxID=1839936 RepID=A0A1F2P616_9EURY|nr:MAG: hypothetical protein SBU_000090 [Candidatus Syntrophoarchaeum butanivorans]
MKQEGIEERINAKGARCFGGEERAFVCVQVTFINL